MGWRGLPCGAAPLKEAELEAHGRWDEVDEHEEEHEDEHEGAAAPRLRMP